ncbi:zinc ribbon domain-containing protein [Candidatus Gracilibacteria bacterium]|nr:zinc ribbon domain-containing protein [Candidatus Gracilibacteria bacterium]
MNQPTQSTTCPSCKSAQRLEARFCDQCGIALSSAGLATRRLRADEGISAPDSAGGAKLPLLARLSERLRRRGTPFSRVNMGAKPPLSSELTRSDNAARVERLREVACWSEPPPGAIAPSEVGVSAGYAVAVVGALRGINDLGQACAAIEVVYRARTDQPIRCSPFQWLLVDALGYRYDLELYKGAVLGAHERRLLEELLAPDGVLRGWIGFACPLEAPLSYARFQENRLSDLQLLFALPTAEYRDLSRR